MFDMIIKLYIPLVGVGGGVTWGSMYSKPAPFIYLALEKTDPFIYLIVQNVDHSHIALWLLYQFTAGS